MTGSILMFHSVAEATRVGDRASEEVVLGCEKLAISGVIKKLVCVRTTISARPRHKSNIATMAPERDTDSDANDVGESASQADEHRFEADRHAQASGGDKPDHEHSRAVDVNASGIPKDHVREDEIQSTEGDQESYQKQVIGEAAHARCPLAKIVLTLRPKRRSSKSFFENKIKQSFDAPASADRPPRAVRRAFVAALTLPVLSLAGCAGHADFYGCGAPYSSSQKSGLVGRPA
ncbi:hypothetical protein [Burkholderia plantarii]|uniref:hypothetical protein n=1 Tax=Burkholderia plantarii TaxID=41899 RepID=UPI000B2AD155|nr:hypothetical protein [Burkholderia plantarii]